MQVLSLASSSGCPRRLNDPRSGRMARRPCPSVPIQKFLSSLSVNLERAVAKALDGRQNIVCRLGPAQGFRVLIVLCNEGLDDCDQLIDRLVSTPFDLFLGDKSEEALHLIDP